jgi:RNA polymerase sigma factor (TIGR02999 family)
MAWNDGDESALEKLVPLVYAELRRLASHHMRRERPDHTLQTTALINEAYLQLVDIRNVQWQNRAHFFALCARLMRRILVDFARSRHYAKRGGGAPHLSLEQAVTVSPQHSPDLVAVDDALHTLATVDDRKAQVVELRFFGGLTVEETAEVLKISPETVRRDWKLAKVWLLRELSGAH